MRKQRIQERSLIGMLITLGVVYGDIGTSPLYVMNALINDAGQLKNATPDYVIGSVSLIFWTLMLITTVKYVLIALRADNHHEGGIFALYALVRHRAKWLIFVALIGGAALLADGTLTPAVTVTSAVEGLKGLPKLGAFSQYPWLVPLTVTVILLVLFMIQGFGTAVVGRSFGPMMLLWFTVIGIFGLINISQAPVILKASHPFTPYKSYSIRLIKWEFSFLVVSSLQRPGLKRCILIWVTLVKPTSTPLGRSYTRL